MIAVLRKSLRAAAYATPAHRWLGLGDHKNYDQAFWDQKLANEWKPYLGGTVSVETRNAISLSLIRIYAPQTRSLLDMACASGSLYRSSGGEDFDYTGVDISEVAIAEGRKKSPTADFHIANLEQFTPTRSFDVIAINEVLYYLPVDLGAAQVLRYSEHLNRGGLMIVSMKQDSKSEAIFRLLNSRLSFVNGILYQEKAGDLEYAIRQDNRRPAYLVAVFNRPGIND